MLMRRTWRLLFGALAPLLIFFLVLTGVRAEFFNQGDEPPGMNYVPGEVMVKFREMPLSERPRTLRGPDAEALVSTLPAMDRFVLQEIQGRADKAFPHLGVVRVKIPEDRSVQKTIQTLRESGVVDYAEPNYLRYAQRTRGASPFINVTRAPITRLLPFPTPEQPSPTPTPAPSPAAPVSPNDDDFSTQWGLNNTGQKINGTSGAADADIDAPEAWGIKINGALTTDGSATIVAVIDSGVDYRHADLQGNMWQDANGSYGIDAINNTATPHDPMDDEGHGTHCAGTIGARGNNALGVSGVNWKARIMALKFLDSDGAGTDADAVECITYALQHKGTNRMVISASWGGYGYSTALHDAIAKARNAGVLFVTAAGNNGINCDYFYKFYPACFADLDNIISVGASDQKDARAYFSNYGLQSVDLFAPGVNILSTFPGNSYGFASGTSMACPFVSGAAALIWSKNPSATYQTIKGFIIGAVDKKTAFAGSCVSGGRLNLYHAVSKLTNNAGGADDSPDEQPTPTRPRYYLR